MSNHEKEKLIEIVRALGVNELKEGPDKEQAVNALCKMIGELIDEIEKLGIEMFFK